MRGTILPICNITTVLCNTDATRDPYGAITIRRTDVSGLPAATTAPRHAVASAGENSANRQNPEQLQREDHINSPRKRELCRRTHVLLVWRAGFR